LHQIPLRGAASVTWLISSPRHHTIEPLAPVLDHAEEQQDSAELFAFLNVLLLTGDTDMMFEICGCTIYDHAAGELRQIIDRSVCRT